jgi:glycoprotein endo-alpha-1,2-mannosidase
MTKSSLILGILIVFLGHGLSGAATAEPLVGVYYYPWYGTFSGGHSVNQSLRGHLAPPQPPELGLYSSRANTTISSHIDHSHQGNIDFWAVSWWGPNSAEDNTIRNNVLTHPRAGELKYAIHYESPGRLGTFENPSFNNLIPDFRYLANNYFQNPNYMKIDERPVVFMYVTRAYFNSQASRDAVASLRSTMLAEFGVDPYIVGDDLFSGGVNLQRAQLWDAITDFDVYGTALQGSGSTTAALSQLAGVYDNARTALSNTDVGFIPTASPGFNDKGVRSGHPAAPRYMVDDPDSGEGDLFSRMLTDVVVARTDPKADNILMINSFNEWHEDTQIEPTILAQRTNVDDSGLQQFTEGHYYEGYGDLYLNILRSATALAGDFNFDGFVNAADYVVWRNGVEIAPTQENYNLWRGNFGQPSGSASGANAIAIVPEPATLMLLIVAAIGLSSRYRHFAW